MKKFLIIDHSLRNLSGHHYEYDVSVAEASEILGYQPIIASNKIFPRHLHPANIQVIAAFTKDWFGQQQFKKTLLNIIIDIIKSVPQFKFQPKYRIYFALQVTYEYLIFIAPQLQTFLLKVKNSLSQLQAALKSDFLKLISPVYLLFKILYTVVPLKTFIWLVKTLIELTNKIPKILSKILKSLLRKLLIRRNTTFAYELKSLLKKLNMTAEDQVFIHTIGVDQLEELLGVIITNQSHSSPYYHILLRRDCHEPVVTSAQGIGLKACINRFYDAGLCNKKVAFYTDTDVLTKQHNALSPIRFITAPIPFRHENIQDCFIATHRKDILTIVYLGDARPEKGYQYLPPLVDALWSSYIQPGKIRFIIQSNFNLPGGEPGMQEARLRLEQYPTQKVQLLKEPLSTEAYYNLLANADIILLPYIPESYAVRSSGVLVESLAAGKPVVVPAKSWMATQVDESRGSIYRSPNEMIDAVLRIVNNFQQFSQAAFAYRSLWRAKHSPDALVKCLIAQRDSLNDFSTELAPSVIYIIDGDSIANQTGSGQVARNHLDYLSRCGYRIYGVFFFHDPKTSAADFVHQVSLAKQVLEKFNVIESWFLKYEFPINLKALNDTISHGKRKPNLELDLRIRSYLKIPQSLKDFLKNQKIDIVLLNYISSWFLVEKLGLDRYPVICEMHDIQSHQYAFYNRREIDVKEFELECNLLEKCNVVLANNLKEMEKIQEFVKNPSFYRIPYIGRLSHIEMSDLNDCKTLVDIFKLSGSDRIGDTSQNNRLLKEKSLDLLYVSSYHIPNIYSLKWFFHEIYLPYLAEHNINFFIAGNIMNAGDLGEISHPKVFICGQVESLSPLYAATRLVILPVIMGAGFNIKTIEALSIGKPVVATSTALRGIEFNRETFPVFDDPEEFADQIINLLNDSQMRLHLAKQGFDLIRAKHEQRNFDQSMNAAFTEVLEEMVLLPEPIESISWKAKLMEWQQATLYFDENIHEFLALR